jgi:hypothetical protein
MISPIPIRSMARSPGRRACGCCSRAARASCIRLSGTGTEGATLRLYLERYAPGPQGLDLDPQEALAPIIRAAHAVAGIAAFTGRSAPDVLT